MKNRWPDVLWVFSILLIVTAGASTWWMVELTPEAGSRTISLNGFEVFPIIAVIVLIQVLSRLIGYLIGPVTKRVLALMMFIGTIVLILPIFTSLESLVQIVLAERISDLTGISGEISQSALIASSDQTSWAQLLKLALPLNLASLFAMVIQKSSHSEAKKATENEDELWEQ